MPLYEYECGACGKRVEVLQRDGRHQALCGEDCVSDGGEWGTGPLTRVLSAHAQFRGYPNRREPAPEPSCGACGEAPGSGAES